MAKFKDTEGFIFPVEEYPRLFDVDIRDWGDRGGHTLYMSIPHYFDTGEFVYEGEGVLKLPLKDLLEEYIDRIISEDGGVGANEFAEYLDRYAKRLREINPLEEINVAKD